jgi:hypothetical protein
MGDNCRDSAAYSVGAEVVMAQKVIVALEDDLDGVADETVRFSL